MRRTRWLLCGLAIVAGAQQAVAADLSDMFLRGSNTVIASPEGTNWEGFYAGGQFGATVSGADFSQATRSLLQFMLRETTIESEAPVSDWRLLGKADTSAMHYGAFVGYNTQWEGAVVGVEGHYNRTDIHLSSTDVMRRIFSVSTGPNDIQVNGTASVRMTDYGTLRARGGWAIGNFLPYATLGLALGRADVDRSVTLIARDPNNSAIILFQDTSSETKAGAFAYGYAAGFGVDMALMQNVFVRAEYEYVKFGWFNDINLHAHSARVGAGIKF
jgi:opacity protein-like surface antigen